VLATEPSFSGHFHKFFIDSLLAPIRVLPSALLNSVGSLEVRISQLNGWPALSPVNASPTALRLYVHDSGSEWIAGPFLCNSFIPPPSGNPALKGRVFSKDGLGRVRNSAQNRIHSRALRPEFIYSSLPVLTGALSVFSTHVLSI